MRPMKNPVNIFRNMLRRYDHPDDRKKIAKIITRMKHLKSIWKKEKYKNK